MQGKKRYLALILFIVIGLIGFTFANPNEELEPVDSNVKKVTENKPEKEAEKAVEKAELRPSAETVEEAEEIIEESVTLNPVVRQELTERLEVVEEAIDASELVATVERMVEESEDKDDILASEIYFNDNDVEVITGNMDPGDVKDNLEDRIDTLIEIFEDEEAPTISGIESGVATKKDVQITIEDNNKNSEVTINVTLNDEKIDFADTFDKEGVYVINVVDAAHNPATLTFTIDKTNPKFTNIKSGGHYSSIDEIVVDDATETTINIKNNDNGETGLNVPLTEDATYLVTATDKAGNSKAIYVAIDNTNPEIISIDGEVTKSDVKVTIKDKFLMNVTINDKKYNRDDFKVQAKNENFSLEYDATEEGVYTINAVDKKGNPATKTFTIDKTTPKFENLASREVDIEYYKVDITDATDTVITLQKNHGTWIEIEEGYELTEEATYQLKAVDAAGNTYTTWIHIDKTAPEIYGVEKEYYNTCVNISAFDRYLNTVTIDDVKYGRKSPVPFVGNGQNENFTFTAPEAVCGEGKHTIVAKDKAGKETKVEFTIDTKNPMVEGVNNNYYYNKPITIKTIRNTSPIKSITIDDKPYEEGTEYFEEGEHLLVAYDMAGNRLRVKFTMDKTNPIVVGVNNKYYYNKPITITTIRDIAPIKSATIDDKPYELGTEYFEEGEHLLVIYDMAGNRLRVKFYMDETKPDLTITQSIGQNPGVCAADKSPNTTVIKSADKEWVITAQKDEHGTYWNCNEIGFLGEGEYTITTTDAAGNVSTGKTIIDLTAPVATPSYTEKTIEVNSVEEFTDFPTFEITDKYTKNIEAKLVSGKVDPTNVGSYKLVYRATDEAGNYSEVTVTVNVVDTTAPEVEPSYTTKKVKEDSADEFTDFPTFKVTDNSKGDVKEELISGSVNIHKVGIYKLVYRFTDESGNYTDKTIIVKVVDTTAPTITGIEDGAYYNTKDTHAIPVASDKNGAILMAKTKLGDVELKALIQNEKELKQVGTYTIYAVDTFGNKSEEYTVHIDPYAPKILVLDRIENISGAYLPIKPVILEHNIDKIEVTLNGKKIDYKAGDQLTKDGKYTMTVTDKANNSTTVEFTMDSVAPTMLVSPTSLGVVDSLDLNDSNNITGLLIDEEAEFQLMKVEKNITVLDKDIPIYKYTKLPENGIIDEEGQYILIAYDKAYNVTAYKFIVDRSAPTVNVEEGKYYSSVTINVEDANMASGTLEGLEDLIPGIGGIISSISKLDPSITIQKGNNWLNKKTIENGYVVDEDGTYTLVAKDVVGVNPLFSKEEQAAHTTTVTFHIDTKKPTANVVEGGVYKKVTVAVADANLDEESITINGKKYDGKEITEEGNYVLEAKDLAGNTLTVNFEVDKTPITISGAKEFNNSSVEIEVNSKDENPTIELNGVEVGKEFTASTEGINEVVVVDKWGNSESVTFTIDTIKPVINNPVKLINEKTTVGAVKGTSIPVVATVTDANPTETEVLPIVSHDKLGDLGQLSSISTTKAEVGTYTLIYNTVDKAGHAAEQVKLYVEVFVDDYVLSFNNIKTEYNYGEAIPSLTFADLKLVSDEETIALADGDITFNEKTSNMVKVGTYPVEAKLTKFIDGKKVVRTAIITFEIKPIQAKITFSKTDGYGEINGDTGKFQYEFDGNSNPFTATVEGILDADKDDIVVTVTYNKDELKPGKGFTATATINNDNYYLVGDTFDFNIMKATATVELPTEIDGNVTVTNRNGIDISKYATITRNTDGKATGTQTNEECKEWGFFKCNKYETVTKNIQIDYKTIQVKSNDYMNVATNNIDLGDIINDILEEKGINIPGLSNDIDYKKIIQLLDLAKQSMIGDAVEAIEVPTEGTTRVYITNVDITEIKN